MPTIHRRGQATDCGLFPHSDNGRDQYVDSRPMRDLHDPDLLLVPGTVLHVRGINSDCPHVSRRHPTGFSELKLYNLPRAFSDHNLITYCVIMRALRSRKHRQMQVAI